MTTESVLSRLKAYLSSIPDVTLYEGHPAVLVNEAVGEIERLAKERDRCHDRLEIDHYWRIGDNDDSDLERVEIPMVERADFPDGIAARDATIAIADEDRASLEAKVAELQEALSQHEQLLTINAVRAVAAEHAPLWLEAADAAADRVRAK